MILRDYAGVMKAPRGEEPLSTVDGKKSYSGLGDNDDVTSGSKIARTTVRMKTHMTQPSQQIDLLEMFVCIDTQYLSSK